MRDLRSIDHVADAELGLIGFVCADHRDLELNGTALRRRRRGQPVLAWSCRRDRRDRSHAVVWARCRRGRREFDRQILDALGLGDGATP